MPTGLSIDETHVRRYSKSGELDFSNHSRMQNLDGSPYVRVNSEASSAKIVTHIKQQRPDLIPAFTKLAQIPFQKTTLLPVIVDRHITDPIISFLNDKDNSFRTILNQESSNIGSPGLGDMWNSLIKNSSEYSGFVQLIEEIENIFPNVGFEIQEERDGIKMMTGHEFVRLIQTKWQRLLSPVSKK